MPELALQMLVTSQVDVAQVVCDLDLSLQLSTRAQGNVEELTVLPPMLAVEPFRNVRRYRNSRASNLGDEPEPFIGWELSRCTVDLDHEHLAVLPDSQITKTAHPMLHY